MTNNMKTIIEYLKILNLDSYEKALSDSDINLQFRKLAKEYHPDKGKYKDDVMMKKINGAKEFLRSNLAEVNNYILSRKNKMIPLSELKKMYALGDYDLVVRELIEIANFKEKSKNFDNEYIDVCFFLGEIYETNGKFINFMHASIWYEKCAKLGNVNSQVKLADWHYDGEKIISNEAKMIEFYKLAAKQGNSWAQFRLGWCYQRGLGVNVNYDSALEWYKMAAAQGQASAMRNIGCLYKDGLIGYGENPEQAFKWLLKSALHGNASAQCNVGWCYENGYGTIRNFNEAFKWYESSARNHDKYGISNLGNCYMQGIGCQVSSSKALEFLTIAANQGDAEDWRRLAGCYYKFGYNSEAFYWFEKGAKNGDLTSIECVIECYQKGVGVKKDKKMVKYWQEKYWDSYY